MKLNSVDRVHVRDLHAVGWGGKGPTPWELMASVKAIRIRSGNYKL